MCVTRVRATCIDRCLLRRRAAGAKLRTNRERRHEYRRAGRPDSDLHAVSRDAGQAVWRCSLRSLGFLSFLALSFVTALWWIMIRALFGRLVLLLGAPGNEGNEKKNELRATTRLFFFPFILFFSLYLCILYSQQEKKRKTHRSVEIINQVRLSRAEDDHKAEFSVLHVCMYVPTSNNSNHRSSSRDNHSRYRVAIRSTSN